MTKVRVPREDDAYDGQIQTAFFLVRHHINQAERYLEAVERDDRPELTTMAQAHAAMALFYQGELKR